MKNINMVLVAFLLFISVAGFAQMESPRADARQQVQRKRIADDWRDGEITRREAVHLRKEQCHVRRNEHRAEADGEITRREKARLEREQDRASRHVHRAKHNEVEQRD